METGLDLPKLVPIQDASVWSRSALYVRWEPMRSVLAALLCYAAWIIQATLAPQVAVGGMTPRCLPIAVALLLWIQTPRGAVIWGAVAGLGFDLLSTTPPGCETALAVGLASAYGWCQRRGVWRMPQMLFPLVLGVLVEVGVVTLFTAGRPEGSPAVPWVPSLLRAALATSLWGGGLLALLSGLSPRWIDRSSPT